MVNHFIRLLLLGDKQDDQQSLKHYKLILMKDRCLMPRFRRLRNNNLILLCPEAKVMSGEFASFLKQHLVRSCANNVFCQVEGVQFKIQNDMGRSGVLRNSCCQRQLDNFSRIVQDLLFDLQTKIKIKYTLLGKVIG